MAINPIVADRYKAEGFFKYVEWNRKRGVLIKIFDQKPGTTIQTMSFESGTYDIEYDQRFEGYRQFYLSREAAVKFMLQLKMPIVEIALTFKQIDGMQIVFKHV